MNLDGQTFGARYKVEAIRYRILSTLLVAHTLPMFTLFTVVSGPDLETTDLVVVNQVAALEVMGFVRTFTYGGLHLVEIAAQRPIQPGRPN